ncbi:MAG: hypothetical protein IJR83_00890 [Clostridia bacterium]|nr:hypothetical protein [Clostridia bacterium]
MAFRLIIDRDPNWAWRISPASREEAEKSLRDMFSVWAKEGSRLTDVLLCILEKSCVIPNSFITWRGDKYVWGSDPEKYPDKQRLCAADPSLYEGLYKAYREYGLDPINIYLDVMRENGINPWLTLRMNDAHHLYDEDINQTKDELFYEALETGHVIGEQYGYFGRCFDYSWQKIRDAVEGLIGEAVMKYDIYGLSLDFLREAFCFDYKNDPDCHKIMTEFIRRIHTIMLKAGERWGHPVKLLLRLPHSPEESMAYGFDVATMVREGLIDAVDPCARWECTNSALPVADWRKVVGPDILLVPGVETLSLRGGEDGKDYSCVSPEQVRAYAAAWLRQGADGLLMANLCYEDERSESMWTLDLEKAESEKRRFIVTYQDIPSGLVKDPYRPLPMDLSGKQDMKLMIGGVRKTDKVRVFIDYEGEDEPTLDIGSLAGLRPVPEGPIYGCCESNLAEKIRLSYNRPLSYVADGLETDGPVCLRFAGEGVVHYVDIRINL